MAPTTVEDPLRHPRRRSGGVALSDPPRDAKPSGQDECVEADVLVVGGGLAGLVAAGELLDAGRRVLLLDQERPADLGGQAYWSLGGIFLVDTPQQRRFRIRDSFELAWQDWQGSAGWDPLGGPQPEDEWAGRWGRAYVEFAAGDERPWLEEQGVRFTPIVGWAERGDG